MLHKITSNNSVSANMRKKLLISYSFFRKIHNFTLKPNHLSSEVCDSVGSSKLQWRGLSRAACVPQETSVTRRKSGQRVPKHERKAMVESFVNKYRSENAGKFPTIKYTLKEVGGSYYVVREIIQELEYKSKRKSQSAKDRPIQDDSQSVLLDDKKAVNTGCVLLEEKRGLQTSSSEGRLSNEVKTISTLDNHCITSESNNLEKHFKEPSSLQMPNDVKTEEAVSSFSESVASESPLLQEEAKHFSTSSSENYGAVYEKTRGYGSEFIDMENHQKMEEKCIEKASYERREHSSSDNMSSKASHCSPQVPNEVKSVETVSSCRSDYVTPGRHQLKEEIEQVSAPIIDKSGSNCSKDPIHDSKFVNIENHPTIEIKSFEKVGFERKVQDGASDLPGVDNPKQKKEQSQGSLNSDESKIDSSNKRESSDAVAPDKSTLWGNLKSFADGVLNIWRKL